MNLAKQSQKPGSHSQVLLAADREVHRDWILDHAQQFLGATLGTDGHLVE